MGRVARGAEYGPLNFIIRNPMRQVINPQLQFGEQDIGRAGYLCHPSVYVLGLRVGYAAYW
jgi:hypothetical protein